MSTYSLILTKYSLTQKYDPDLNNLNLIQFEFFFCLNLMSFDGDEILKNRVAGSPNKL